MKPDLKKKAVGMRKKGFSYGEILKEIPVAKSTLSLWLREVGLSKQQHHKLTEKKLAAAHRGGEKRRLMRVQETEDIKQAARKEITVITDKELWLMGIMLYWAEGLKEKPWRTEASIDFCNSDPVMIRVYLRWLFNTFKLTTDDLTFNIYIHGNNQHRTGAVKKYWAVKTGIPLPRLKDIYFKKHRVHTVRKNIGRDYYGLMRIRVRKSTSMSRKVSGWIEGVGQYWGVV